MKISVCIATFNGERFIHEQLSSILSQLSKYDEVIISDDHSTDKTESIIIDFDDPRIVFLKNKYRSGYTKNFEHALMHCTGNIIFLADQDDVWKSNKVQIVKEELKLNDFVVSDCKIVDAKLNLIQPSHFKIHNVKVGFFHNLLLPRYVGACMAFKRNVLDFALPFPENQKYAPHDYWISLIAEMKFKVKIIELPLILYRRHDSNASNGGLKSRNTLTHKLMVRFYTLISIMKQYWIKY